MNLFHRILCALALLLTACGIMDAARDTVRTVEKQIEPDPPKPGRTITIGADSTAKDTTDPTEPRPPHVP